jgi:N-acetylneuraminate synthase
MIDAAKVAGCDYVKFQKRTPELCVPEHQKNVMRSTPWGDMRYIDYKHKTEFGKEEYDEINKHCASRDIKWFASVWDLPSVDFMLNYGAVGKIPSALITADELVKYSRKKFDVLLISTGMSNEEEIEHAVITGDPDVIFHTNSTYPSKIEELNLNYIRFLKNKYPGKSIGYSGHEFGLTTTFATVPMGVEWIERHITLDRTMWGSDQMASIEPHGLIKLTKGIRSIEAALGISAPRQVMGSELKKRKSLRG